MLHVNITNPFDPETDVSNSTYAVGRAPSIDCLR
jgi:hypothetical protein